MWQWSIKQLVNLAFLALSHFWAAYPLDINFVMANKADWHHVLCSLIHVVWLQLPCMHGGRLKVEWGWVVGRYAGCQAGLWRQGWDAGWAETQPVVQYKAVLSNIGSHIPHPSISSPHNTLHTYMLQQYTLSHTRITASKLSIISPQNAFTRATL